MDPPRIQHISLPSRNNWCHALCSGSKTDYLKELVKWLAESERSPLKFDWQFKDRGRTPSFLKVDTHKAYVWIAGGLLNVPNKGGMGAFDVALSQCFHPLGSDIRQLLTSLGAVQLRPMPIRCQKGETSRINFANRSDTAALYNMVG